jgi:hypothetical protein
MPNMKVAGLALTESQVTRSHDTSPDFQQSQLLGLFCIVSEDHVESSTANRECLVLKISA